MIRYKNVKNIINFRKTFYSYVMAIRENDRALRSIINFEVLYDRLDGMYVVVITSNAPGVVIGKSGEFINGIKAFMQKELKFPIRISLREDLQWVNVYK